MIDKIFYPTYPVEKCDLYQEKSPIFGQNFQHSLYSDEFLQKLFTDILKTSEEKVMVVCSSITDNRNRRFVTCALDAYQVNI